MTRSVSYLAPGIQPVSSDFLRKVSIEAPIAVPSRKGPFQVDGRLLEWRLFPVQCKEPVQIDVIRIEQPLVHRAAEDAQEERRLRIGVDVGAYRSRRDAGPIAHATRVLASAKRSPRGRLGEYRGGACFVHCPAPFAVSKHQPLGHATGGHDRHGWLSEVTGPLGRRVVQDVVVRGGERFWRTRRILASVESLPEHRRFDRAVVSKASIDEIGIFAKGKTADGRAIEKLSLNNLASVREALGHAADAEQLLVKSLEMSRRIYKGDHPLVAEELERVYTIGYYPQNQNYDGRWRRVKVQVKRPGVTFRTREGYYAQ